MYCNNDGGTKIDIMEWLEQYLARKTRLAEEPCWVIYARLASPPRIGQ